MLLAIDVGNSNLSAGVFQGETLLMKGKILSSRVIRLWVPLAGLVWASSMGSSMSHMVWRTSALEPQRR